MRKRRLVVTGHDSENRAIVASDKEVEFVELPGMDGWGWLDMWAASDMHFPDDGSRPEVSWMYPPVGGVRYGHSTIPPKTDAKYGSESESEGPDDLKDSMSDDGMHRSPTLDIMLILRGSCICTLDDGVQVQLNAGDSLIENGTIHKWSNPFDEECEMVGIMVGARNDLV